MCERLITCGVPGTTWAELRWNSDEIPPNSEFFTLKLEVVTTTVMCMYTKKNETFSLSKNSWYWFLNVKIVFIFIFPKLFSVYLKNLSITSRKICVDCFISFFLPILISCTILYVI